MGNASQAHKLNVRGYNSIGGRKALAKFLSNSGTDVAPVVIELNGLWGTGDTVTATVNIGAGNLVANYTPAGNEDAVAAATGLAAALNAQLGVTSNAASNVVKATKTTAGTISLVSLVIT